MTGIEPGRVEIELTETYAAELSKDTMGAVTALRQAGFRVAIDDFGVGYTSFQQLLHYPADTIKLDMVIVDSLTRPAMQQSLAALYCLLPCPGQAGECRRRGQPAQQTALLEALAATCSRATCSRPHARSPPWKTGWPCAAECRFPTPGSPATGGFAAVLSAAT
ncbi:hypothetical protein SSTU70S_00285 [Stutzerimonas stutzeri]